MYLWRWLGDMIYPLSYTELEAWGRLTYRELTRWEVEAMIKLDRVRADV